MSYFDKSDTYREQAFECLLGTPAGTPVNAAMFTKTGRELDLLEYQYVLREADIPLEVWVVATVYAQQYNWNTRRGVWVNQYTLSQHAKMDICDFFKAESQTIDLKWVITGKDWLTGKESNFPAIGGTIGARPKVLTGNGRPETVHVF